MELPSKTVIEVLTYLMPGFITAAIVHNLTPAPRPIPFERVVVALIFTVVVQTLVFMLKTSLLFSGTMLPTFGNWTNESEVIWSVLLAISLGLVIAHLANTDRLHARFRKMRITQQTSYSSEWYGALAQNRGFIVLHLTGRRRLYGWPEEWPSGPDQGHFVIAQAEWLDDDNKSMPLNGVEKIVVKASDVEMVELMRPLLEDSPEV